MKLYVVLTPITSQQVVYSGGEMTADTGGGGGGGGGGGVGGGVGPAP